MDPIALRGIERILIILAATFTVYLGYRLFIHGVGGNQLECKTSWGKFVLGGSGPGLAFMIYGCGVLTHALLYGGASVDHTQQTVSVPAEASVGPAAPAKPVPMAKVPTKQTTTEHSQLLLKAVPLQLDPAK